LVFILLFAAVGTALLLISRAAPTPGLYGSIEQDQVNRINYARAVNGRAGVQHIECLNSVAEQWTQTMASKGSISHNPNLASMVTSACGNTWDRITENVGVGNNSGALFNAFMSSTSHKANILDSKVTKVGVGAYYGSDGRLWITQVYANCYSCGGAWGTAAKLPSDPVQQTPTTGNTFYLKNSNSSGVADFTFKYGNPGDKTLFCDWDGNGTDTAGVFRNGIFHLSNNNSTAAVSFAYGNPDDIPVCGDWDGDGIDTIGVYRPSTSTFYVRNHNSTGSSAVSFRYGDTGDKPLVGDWDGNGTDTVAIWRNGVFYLKNSFSGGSADIRFGYGIKTDKPIVGDWDGNGTDTIGVWRNSNFYLRNSNTGGAGEMNFTYGISSDKPVVGDWDGNRTTTIGVHR
jgi:hypothetical protein